MLAFLFVVVVGLLCLCFACCACTDVDILRRWLSKKAVVYEPKQAAVLITGGAGGIGRFVAEMMAKAGWTVFVTVRKAQDVEDIKAQGLLIPILFDVTDNAQAGPAVEQVKTVLTQKSLKLAAVINNAGINPEGDKMQKEAEQAGKDDELAETSVAERVFTTNVVGVARVSRAFLPMLKADTGRLLIIGSYFGSMAGALGMQHAYYEASKFAVEGLADNLRRSSGIPVVLIKPGNISTGMNSNGEDDCSVVFKAVNSAITTSFPRPRYWPGRVKGLPVWLLCWIFEHLPEPMSDLLF